MKKAKVTMKDVAELAGVSITSVSHVINKTRRVEAGTKERVVAAIKRLNYSPNIFARSLRGKGTKLLGLIISDIRDSFFAELSKSVEVSALEYGYNVILCDSENKWEKERLYLETFMSKGMDGIIFSPADLNRVNTRLISSQLPFVQIDRKIEQYQADFVGIDNVGTSRGAVLSLIEEGRRHIGYVGFDNSVFTSQARMKGWREAMDEHGLGRDGYALQMPYHFGPNGFDLSDYFSRHPELDGLVCCNNNCCHEVMLELERMGKKIPDDIRLVTYDDSKWFDFLKYPVSVIVQPSEAIGRLAVDCVVERIEADTKAVRKEIILDTEFIIRG